MYLFFPAPKKLKNGYLPKQKQTLSLKNNAVKKVFSIHMKKHRKVPTKMPEAKCFKKNKFT